MDSCIICYEDKNLILPQNCNCKIMLHKQCLDKMIECLDIDCPSCRHKIIKKNVYINNQNNYSHYSRPSLRIFFCFFIILLLIFLLAISILIKFLFYVIFF